MPKYICHEILSNAGKSLVGLEIEGLFKILEMQYEVYCSEIMSLYSPIRLHDLETELRSHQLSEVVRGQDNLIILETYDCSGVTMYFVLQALRYYKSCDVFGIFSNIFQIGEDNEFIICGQVQSHLYYEHARWFYSRNVYELEEEEKIGFEDWYYRHKDMFSMRTNDLCCQIMRMYEYAFKSDNCDLAFITLFIALEIVAGKEEYLRTERIKQSVLELLKSVISD